MTKISRRKFLAVGASGISLAALSGCGAFTDGSTMDEIMALLSSSATEDAEGDEDTSESVTLAVTYPAGRSPKVFTSGWVFGARCLDGTDDISDTVKWSGTGVFNPAVGARSRPIFNSEGQNTITLSVSVRGKTIQKTVNVTAVSPGGYISVGAQAECLADAHGCPACPHPTVGPIVSGSPNVLVNGKSAARVGDTGRHAACCGPNTFEIVSGDSEVLINGRAAATQNSQTRHCGGMGRIKRT